MRREFSELTGVTGALGVLFFPYLLNFLQAGLFHELFRGNLVESI
jgi:hypothetical protein